MPPDAELNEAQARRYLRDLLQFGFMRGRVVWAVSADEASLFRKILESVDGSDRVLVVDTSAPGFDASVPVKVPA